MSNTDMLDKEFDVLEQEGPCPSPEHRRLPGETACQYCGAELRIEVSVTAKCPPHHFIIPPPPDKGTKMPAVCKRCGDKKTFKTGLVRPRKAGGQGVRVGPWVPPRTDTDV